MNSCNECHEFMIYPNTHRCLPQWDVCDPEYDDTYWFKIHAFDEEDAATKGAEWLDMHNGEGPSQHVFIIKKAGSSDTPSEWNISFEYEVRYSACPK